MNQLLNEYADMTYSEYELHIQGIVDSITKGEKQTSTKTGQNTLTYRYERL